MVKEVQPDLNKTYRMAAQFIPAKAEGAKVGVENKWLTWEAGNFLRETFGADHVADCSKVLNEARAIKTPWEIEVLRHNAQVAERAMNITAKQIVPGMTTADVHHIFHKVCLELAPDMTAVSQSHTIGADIAPAWIPCETRINQGDLIRLDGGPTRTGINPIWGEHTRWEIQPPLTRRNYTPHCGEGMNGQSITLGLVCACVIFFRGHKKPSE